VPAHVIVDVSKRERRDAGRKWICRYGAIAVRRDARQTVHLFAESSTPERNRVAKTNDDWTFEPKSFGHHMTGPAILLTMQAKLR
jgi:hypothetical protein